MKNKLVKIVIVLAVLGIIGLTAVIMSMDTIIKRGVETVGPQVAKVDVKLGGVNVGLFSGKGSIKDLVVGNPEGFKTPSAVQMGKASMAIDAGSIFSDKVVIRSMVVEAPEFTLEGNLTGNNLTKILANIEAFSATENKSAPTNDKGKKQRKIQVDEFVITGAKVNLSLNMSVLGGKSMTVPIPDIRLTDLGKTGDGITAADLAEKVTREILAKATVAASKAVADIGKAGLESASGFSKGATEEAQKKLKGVGDLFKKK